MKAWSGARSLARALAVIGGWAVACGGASPGYAQTIGYTASVFVARSTYETERAMSVYLFNGVDASLGPVRLSASIPLIRQRLTLLEPVTDPTVSMERTNAGFGDPLVRVDVRVVDDLRRNLQVAVAGAIKPAIVDAADGFGTGVADYAVGGSAFKGMGATMVLADVLFWKYGDPEGVDFENALSYSVGIGRTLGTGRWSTMASLSGFSPVGDTPAPLVLTVGVMTLTGRGQSLAITAGFGLTSTATDFSIGTNWRIQN